MNSFTEHAVTIKQEKCDSNNYRYPSCSVKAHEHHALILNSFSVAGGDYADSSNVLKESSSSSSPFQPSFHLTNHHEAKVPSFSTLAQAALDDVNRYEYTITSKETVVASNAYRESQHSVSPPGSVSPLELTNHGNNNGTNGNVQVPSSCMRSETAGYASVIQSSSGSTTSSTSAGNFLTKPPYTYPALITMAIKSAKDQQLTLREIYDYLRRNFPYFATTNKKGWQNSIRHNLSLNKCFKKIVRPDGCSKKGCLWKLDPKHPDMYEDGNYCRRRRSRNMTSSNRKNNDPMSKSYYATSLALNANPFLPSTYATVPPNTCVTNWPLSHVQQHRQSGQYYPSYQSQSLHPGYGHVQGSPQQQGGSSSSTPESPLELTGHVSSNYSTPTAHAFTGGTNTAFPGHCPATYHQSRIHAWRYQPY